QHLLPVGRGTQHLQVGLDALDEGIRTLDLHALQARVAVEHHVDHVRIRVARADQLVAHAGRVDQAIGADVAEGVGACAGIDAVAVAAGGDGVVAEAAGQDVLAAGGDDGVVALAAFDVVVALAAGDAVVAVAAVQGVAAVAGHDAVVAGTAEDIVEAVAGIDDVVALATIDAVVARAALDGVLTGAGLDDEVDRHRRIDLDVVVAVAGAHGQLLALGQADVVLLAIDVEAQLAVLALGDLDLVIAAAGREYQLVGQDVVLAAVLLGRVFARDLDVGGAAQLVDEQRLPGAAGGLLAGAGVAGVAVDLGGLVAATVGVDACMVDVGHLARAFDRGVEQGLLVALVPHAGLLGGGVALGGVELDGHERGLLVDT